jgi:hypothetical protein
MDNASDSRNFSALRRFIRERPPVEQCELCSVELAPEHQHLIEPAQRKIMCACEACAILFSGQAGTKYKRVPRRVLSLNGFRITDAQWEALMIPINMAFFFHSGPLERIVALYPSPAGATESLLSLNAWEDIEINNPILKSMELDVEALLVSRIDHMRGQSTAEYFIAPIDECYKLVGLIRANWRGFSGGAEVWDRIGQFFEQLKKRARPVSEAVSA